MSEDNCNHDYLTLYKNGIADRLVCRNCHDSKEVDGEKYTIYDGVKMDARKAVKKLFEGRNLDDS